MACSAAGVVGVPAIPILAWLFQDCSNHPAAACGCGCPSLSKEGGLLAEFRDRNLPGNKQQKPEVRTRLGTSFMERRDAETHWNRCVQC